VGDAHAAWRDALEISMQAVRTMVGGVFGKEAPARACSELPAQVLGHVAHPVDDFVA